ncbi:MAG: L-threonine 3-dehydrogenase [Bacteriovoracaceae bacterium]|nr:L-threonine 3-dehydrogenase [Bacteriovoracaceae bacterium]
MKALIKKLPERGLWMGELPMPSISDHEVLIKIKQTAICGTDVHIYLWDEWSQENIKTPMAIGHEFFGVIEEVGKHVTHLKKGQRVSGEGHIICGQCRNCRAGKGHLCINTVGIGVGRQGAFAEYLCMPAWNVFPIPEGISDDEASIMDPMGNAVHTALSFDMVGEDVLVTGAGPIGIMAALTSQHVGARHVVLTDINPDRLALAKKAGVKNTVLITEKNLKDVMHELNMKEGFDVALEMSGSEKALDDILSFCKNGAKIALLGIFKKNVSVKLNQAIFKGMFIKGITGREIFETWYKMCSMIQSGLDVKPVITHHFPYTKFEEAFELMVSGKSGKIILDWDK